MSGNKRDLMSKTLGMKKWVFEFLKYELYELNVEKYNDSNAVVYQDHNHQNMS